MKTKKILKRAACIILTVGIITTGIPCGNPKHGITGFITTEAATNGIKVNSDLTAAQQKELTFNARFYASTNKDVVDLLGDNETVLYNHYLEYGIKEGRCGTPVFDPVYYLENNGDIMAAFGRDYVAAYKHWLEYGYKEGRASSKYYEGSYYRSYYGDLANLSSYELVRHFLNYGIFEQRTASTTGQKVNLGIYELAKKVELYVQDFKQTDKRWKNVYIKDKTIGQVGCLLTALAMKYSFDTGTTTYPNAMKSKLSFTRNNVYWSSIERLGYSYSGDYNIGITDAIMSTIYLKLKEGIPVIIGGKSDDSTHWVVVTGYTGTDIGNLNPANFTINDPGSSTRKTLKEFLAKYPKVLRLIY